MRKRITRFARFAWGVLAFNLGVVAWGAYVRATGSGAGCGSHWPMCNGEVFPRAPALATLIEFTHRLTSGVALLLVFAMLVWAVRAFPRGHRVRRGAVLAMGFMVLEALLGAGLVLFELVADNASLVRAGSMAAHLMNTFLLLAAITLTAWWASGGPDVRLRGQGVIAASVALALCGVLLISVSGAVAALGDTLFPARSLADGVRQDFAPAAHLLVRLRIWHPIIAIAVAMYVLFVVAFVRRLRPAGQTRRLGALVVGAVLLQVAGGFLNVALLAPVWMQLVHLLMADAVWLTTVVFGASALAAPHSASPAATPPSRPHRTETLPPAAAGSER